MRHTTKMSESIRVKYRSWHNATPPKPIKLSIPGWSGCDHTHKTGSKAQPWHCQPFVDGSIYGLELTYPFSTECHAVMRDGKMCFEGDFTIENEITKPQGVTLPPFACFADGHFGMTSCLDIEVPDAQVLRLESHPRFYTDTTGTVPCVVPGHLQTSWWPKIFFVVFKNPAEGQRYIFRSNEPYAQVLIIPKKVSYDIEKMTDKEVYHRGYLDGAIADNARSIAGQTWHSEGGHQFDDKYKKLSTVAAKNGCPYVGKHIEIVKSKPRGNIRRKLLKGKNEDPGVQAHEKERGHKPPDIHGK